MRTMRRQKLWIAGRASTAKQYKLSVHAVHELGGLNYWGHDSCDRLRESWTYMQQCVGHAELKIGNARSAKDQLEGFGRLFNFLNGNHMAWFGNVEVSEKAPRTIPGISLGCLRDSAANHEIVRSDSERA
jgi:hypothetical protein